ncbi:MAG: hypothetical protein IJ772_05565 [Bacilli bacterium]|nr:hypothetical protein [Bacilli bacterium]
MSLEGQFSLERELYVAKKMLDKIEEVIKNSAKEFDHIQLFQVISLIEQMKNGIVSNIFTLRSNFDIKVTHPNHYRVLADEMKEDTNDINDVFTYCVTNVDAEFAEEAVDGLCGFDFESQPIEYLTEFISSLFKLTLFIGNICNAYTASKLFLEEHEFQGPDADYIRKLKTSMYDKYREDCFRYTNHEGNKDYFVFSPEVEKIFKEAGYFEVMITMFHIYVMKTANNCNEIIKEELKQRKIKNGKLLENFNAFGIEDYREIKLEKEE